MIQKWKPWDKSTGPKTESGKQKASENSYKHGMRSSKIIDLQKTMTEIARMEREARNMVT